MKRQPPTIYFAHKRFWRLNTRVRGQIKNAIIAKKQFSRSSSVLVRGARIKYVVEVPPNGDHEGWINVNIDSIPTRFFDSWSYAD